MELSNSKSEDRVWFPRIEFDHQIIFPTFVKNDESVVAPAIFHKEDLLPNQNDEIILCHHLGGDVELVSGERLVGAGPMKNIPANLQAIHRDWFFYKFADGCTVFSNSNLKIRETAALTD